MKHARPVLRLVLIAAVAFALPLVYYSDVVSRWYGDLTADDGPPDKYFYDTVAGEYFIDDTEELPPIESPAGNPAVRAHFYSCGSCDEDEMFLGYYEKYSPEAKETMYDALREGPGGEPHLVYAWAFEGRLRSADGESWVKAESPEGRELAESLSRRCGENRKLRYCSP